MGLLSSLSGIIGFAIGVSIGILVGFSLFIYSGPKQVREPIPRPLYERETSSIVRLLPKIPIWVKSPDYERVDWLNKFVYDMWPFLDKAVCTTVRTMTRPMFAEYAAKFQLQSIEFQSLTLGTLPPIIQGIKVFETNESELVLEPAIKWAGNPNITLVLKVLSLQLTIQLVDLQISASPRIALKPLVPTLPCFGNIVVSLLEKPNIDFGLHILGGDVMAVPVLYRFVQNTIRKQVASLYLWPQTLEIPVLDGSALALQKPTGILHVNVVRAQKLMKKDILGTSDPYVTINLTGERLPVKKTTVKKRNLNPEWNEKFKLILKDPNCQVLELQVFDWDKVGTHDLLGMQFVPLGTLTPNETKEFELGLLKNSKTQYDAQDNKQRGKLVVELTFVPFREDGAKLDGLSMKLRRDSTKVDRSFDDDEEVSAGSGLLSVTVIGAQDVEGERHQNPYAVVLLRGEKKKTKILKKCRDPLWNEAFEFMLEEPPMQDKIRIEVKSEKRGFTLKPKALTPKELLGHVEINLGDVVNNGRINEKYNLINSKNGVIHVELGWRMG